MKICDLQAFSVVPINVFICKFCLINLKNVSINHRLLYNSAMVVALHSKLLVIKTIVLSSSSIYTATRRNSILSNPVSLAAVPVK